MSFPREIGGVPLPAKGSLEPYQQQERQEFNFSWMQRLEATGDLPSFIQPWLMNTEGKVQQAETGPLDNKAALVLETMKKGNVMESSAQITGLDESLLPPSCLSLRAEEKALLMHLMSLHQQKLAKAGVEPRAQEKEKEDKRSSNDGKNSHGKEIANSLEGHIAIFKLVKDNLLLNSRNERDWSSLYKDLHERYRWGSSAFNSVSVFKQRCKLLFQERRKRQHTEAWKRICSAGTVDKVQTELQHLFHKGEIPSEVVNWQWTAVSEYLASRTEFRNKSPGSVVEWSAEARKEMTDAFLAIHKWYGNGSPYRVHAHFCALLQVCEVEMGILSKCDCESCRPWGLSLINATEAELRFQWTRSRSKLMSELLILHQAYPLGGAKFYNAASHQIPALRNWCQEDILVLLHSGHSCKTCSACLVSSKQAPENTLGETDIDSSAANGFSSSGSIHLPNIAAPPRINTAPLLSSQRMGPTPTASAVDYAKSDSISPSANHISRDRGSAKSLMVEILQASKKREPPDLPHRQAMKKMKSKF